MNIFMLLALIISVPSFAIEITVVRTACGGLLNAAQCDSLDEQVNIELNDSLPDSDAQRYANGTANATVVANAGKGSDYGQNFDLFTLKASGGLGLDASSNSFSDVIDDPAKADGLAFGGGITAGVNLDLLPIEKIGFIDFSKMDLFVNFNSFSINRDIDGAKAKGSMSGFGVMARYKIIDGADLPSKYLMQWGGLHLHTGFQKSTMDISYNKSFDNQQISAQGGSLNGQFSNAKGIFELKSDVSVIPIEISTYMRFLYVFTLYGGAGVDIASGSSNIKFNGSGSVSGGLSANSTDYQANLTADESATGSPETTNFRGFIGLQLNAPVASIYVHLNKNISEDIIGANVGLNIAW